MTEIEIDLAQTILGMAVQQSDQNFITGALRDVGMAATMPLAHLGATEAQAVDFALEVAHMAAGAASEIFHDIGGLEVSAVDMSDDISIRFRGIEVMLLEFDGSILTGVDYAPQTVEAIVKGLRSLPKAA